MPIFYNTTFGDTGATESASTQPILNGEPLDGTAVLNRSEENLRNRTEILRRTVDGLRLLTAAETLFYADDGNNPSNPTQVSWDGRADPSVSPVPAQGTAASGQFYMPTSTSRLVVRLANAPQTSIPASFTYTPSGGPQLTFTANITAANGANALQVLVLTSASIPSTTAVAAWSQPSITIPPHVSVPPPLAPPTGLLSLLTLTIASDGSTTIANVIAAITAAVYNSGEIAPISFSALPSGSTTIPATAALSTPAHLTGGLDTAEWYVTNAVLNSFYSTGAVTTTLTQTGGVTSNAAPQTVTVGATTNISLGEFLDVDTGVNYESVQVVSLGIGTIGAIFTKSHAQGISVRKRPNIFHGPDTLVAVIGNGRTRLLTPAALTVNNLHLVSNGGFSEDDYIIPLAFIPTNSSVLFIGSNDFSIAAGSTNSFTQFAQIAGDLLGPGSIASDPIVVRATGSSFGTLKLAGDLAGPSTSATVPTVVRGSTTVNGIAKLSKAAVDPLNPIVLAVTEKNAVSGVAELDSSRIVIGTGLEVDVAGALSIGTTTATSISLGAPTGTRVTNVTIQSNSTNGTTALQGSGGTISVSNSGVLLASVAGTLTGWQINAAGVLEPLTGNNLISNLLNPVSAQDAATKNYVDTSIHIAALFRDSSSTPTAVPSGTDTKLVYITSNLVGSSITVTSLSRLTINTSGKYRIFASAALLNNSNVFLAIKLYKNGSSIRELAFMDTTNLPSGSTFSFGGEVLETLSSTDFLEIFVNSSVSTSSIRTGQLLVERKA